MVWVSNMNTTSGKKNAKQGSVTVGLGGLLFVAGAGLLIGYQVQTKSAAASVSRPPTAAEIDAREKAAAERASDFANAQAEKVRQKTEAFLSGNVELEFEGTAEQVGWKDLGLHVDDTLLERGRLDSEGNLVGLIPVAVDRDKAQEKLLELKTILDRPAENARMNMEKRTVSPEKPGFGIQVFSSVSAVESAARTGLAKVTLPGVEQPAYRTVADLGIDDISHVMASFKTRFSISEKSRNANLKLVASRIDGHVLQPGEEFSFNKVVGARSEKEGYKTAHVISKGEMVDGMAGGACQISTTLHGAAFFAGLDIIESIPHSRPSTYVHMGLDATVVWPYVDVKLKNPYDFPVVIHYRVARGESFVEILGKERPYDKVSFIRTVDERLDFETITREDDEIGFGHMVVDQPGYPGYKVTRRRLMYKDGKVVKQDRWKLQYQPVVEYVRMGMSPNPNLKPPKTKKPHGPKPAKGTFRLDQ